MSLIDLPKTGGRPDDMTERSRQTIAKLVSAFSTQDIDGIMELFSMEAVYCDIRGHGQRGGEYRGKHAIRHAFARQFRMMGQHTFEAPTIVADGQTAFASWTMVLGQSNDPNAKRFEGADHFELDSEARVTLKKAWLKGQPRLGRNVLLRNPLSIFRFPRYALSG